MSKSILYLFLKQISRRSPAKEQSCFCSVCDLKMKNSRKTTNPTIDEVEMDGYTEPCQHENQDEEPSRLVMKDGTLNLKHSQLSWGNPLYTENAIVLKWVPLFQLIIMTFLCSWLFFASVYWGMEYINENLCEGPGDMVMCTKNDTERIKNTRCVEGVYDFSSALLFSVETMTTIGYGSRALTDRCPFIIFLATFQSLFGVVIFGIMTGLLMSKFQMPGRRKDFIWFSKQAVVLMRNRGLYLVVKVADQRDNKLTGVTTTALMVTRTVTEEGEDIPSDMKSLRFGIDKDSDTLPFMWPICIAHKIDSSSPLYNFHPDMMQLMEFELLLWVTGTTSSGGLVKARTSFLPREIVWGGSFNFDSVFHKHPTHITVMGAQSTFHQVETEQLPRYSADILEREGVIDRE